MTLSEAQPTTSSLQQTLANVFGYTQFRAGQEAVIQQLLEGRDTLVLMPTGGGKSLCYQLPAIHQPGLTVVISPLLSLMQDQVEALQAMGVAAEALHSGLSSEQALNVLRRLQNGEVSLLYVSPERACPLVAFYIVHVLECKFHRCPKKILRRKS